MKYYIENMATGVVMGIYEAECRDDAIEEMARDAGYESADEIPGGVDPALVVVDAEGVCADCGATGVYSPDPDTVGSTLSHDDQGLVVCDECWDRKE